MNREMLRALLQQVHSGQLDIATALDQLRDLPFADLGFAKIDHHRGLRRGLGEAIFAEPKTVSEVVEIARHMWHHSGRVIATRVTVEQGAALAEEIAEGTYDGQARTFCATKQEKLTGAPVAVVTAGTADRPVAAEAHNTLVHYGHPVIRLDDCGVAGIHRLLANMEELHRAEVLVVVAGMEGALPSVVAGLVSVPVIGVPTSVGYGAAFSGLTALLGMLNSCAQGVTVVNIDNGFGAACAAALIARKRDS